MNLGKNLQVEVSKLLERLMRSTDGELQRDFIGAWRASSIFLHLWVLNVLTRIKTRLDTSGIVNKAGMEGYSME